MYPQHFQLDHRPFTNGPGSRFFVANRDVQAAVGQLQEAMLARDAVMLVSGGPGVGKTALLEHARAALGEQAVIAWADLRQAEPEHLFDLLLLSLGEEAGDGSGPRSWQQLRAAVRQHNAAGRQVCAAVDVSAITAERARRLLRLAFLVSEPGTQLNLILQGPHTLHKLLDVPGLIHLRQRVILRHRVRPLTQAETTEYLVDRLRGAGGDPGRLLDEKIAGRVFHYVAGVPRLINTLMEGALATAAARDQERLDAELIDDVARGLGWKPLGGSRPATRTAATPVPGARPRRTPSPLEAAASRTRQPISDAEVATTPAGKSATPVSEMTAALMSPMSLELTDAPQPPARAAEPGTAKAPDAPRPPPGVPEMDPMDTSATGMLRLEDLDDRFAESIFAGDGEDSAGS